MFWNPKIEKLSYEAIVPMENKSNKIYRYCFLVIYII